MRKLKLDKSFMVTISSKGSVAVANYSPGMHSLFMSGKKVEAGFSLWTRCVFEAIGKD